MKGGVVNLADGGTRTLRVSHAVRRTNQGAFVLQTSCASLENLGRFEKEQCMGSGGGSVCVCGGVVPTHSSHLQTFYVMPLAACLLL